MEKQAKQVIVVRKDLNMRKGKIGAQVAHASMGALLKAFSRTKMPMGGLHLRAHLFEDSAAYAWLEGPFTKICVYVNTEQELLDLVRKAEYKNILHCLITDSGKTEFNGVPTITCAAFGPEWVDTLDELTKHLPLL